MRLENKVIFLTGGSTGIGLDCARAYVREGATVILVARDGVEASRQASLLGERHLGFECDISNDDEVRLASKRTLDRFGKLDVIHNNAGIATPSKTLHETSDQEWDAFVAEQTQPPKAKPKLKTLFGDDDDD